MSDEGFIGETEARLRVVLGKFSVGDNRGRFVVGEELTCDYKT
jgi:hypothetical protein